MFHCRVSGGFGQMYGPVQYMCLRTHNLWALFWGNVGQPTASQQTNTSLFERVEEFVFLALWVNGDHTRITACYTDGGETIKIDFLFESAGLWQLCKSFKTQHDTFPNSQIHSCAVMLPVCQWSSLPIGEHRVSVNVLVCVISAKSYLDDVELVWKLCCESPMGSSLAHRAKQCNCQRWWSNIMNSDQQNFPT